MPMSRPCWRSGPHSRRHPHAVPRTVGENTETLTSQTLEIEVEYPAVTAVRPRIHRISRLPRDRRRPRTGDHHGLALPRPWRHGDTDRGEGLVAEGAELEVCAQRNGQTDVTLDGHHLL